MIVRTHEEYVKEQMEKTKLKPSKCPCCGSNNIEQTFMVHIIEKPTRKFLGITLDWEATRHPIYECMECHTRFIED